jgi:hypothetical protein
MKLPDMIKQAVVSLVMTGALAGMAYAQSPPKTQAELEQNIKKSLFGPENEDYICLVADFAYLYGYNFTRAYATWESPGLEGIHYTFELKDPDRNGPSIGDTVKVTAKYSGMAAEASEKLTRVCRKVDDYSLSLMVKDAPYKFILENDPGMDPQQHAFHFAAADAAFQKGIFNKSRSEYVASYSSSFQKSENDPTIHLICDLRLSDLDKNGVDVGDLLYETCRGEGLEGWRSVFILEGKRGNFTPAQLDKMFPQLK